jgi:hypothetical protein
MLRPPGARNARPHVPAQFDLIVRSRVRGVFTHLRPNELGWIEFRRAGRKRVGMDSRVGVQKAFDLAPTMNRMLIPHHHDRTGHGSQQLFQKSNHMVTVQRLPIRLKAQLDLMPRRREAQRTDQIEALVMLDARAQNRRLAPRSPSPLERRDQRKAAFIGENQAGVPVATLFLSAAIDSVASGQWRHRPVPAGAAGVSGNSSPRLARDTRRHSVDSALQTIPRSNGQCGQVSSNLLHSHRRMHRAPRPVLSGGVGRHSGAAVARACAVPDVADAAPRSASVGRCAASRLPARPPAPGFPPDPTGRGRADDGPPVVDWFQKVSCASLWHRIAAVDIRL